MKTSALARCCAALMPLLLMACAAANSVHYAFPGPGKSMVFSTDAKLRNTLIFQDAKGNYRYCSENGPSAMSAGSFSLASILGLAPGTQDVSLSQASSETVASLEHTQTVNLLHASLYRTCELWASGALQPNEFYALAARTHRSMVAVLAIEQMTGVVRPKSTVISGPAARAIASQTEEFVKVWKQYQTERAAAEGEEKAAKAAYDTANAAFPKDAADGQPICKYPSAPPDSGTKFADCKAAEASYNTKKGLADTARERENYVLKELGQLAGGAGAGTEAGDFDVGGLDPEREQLSGQALMVVARAAENIALTAGIDESLMFCVSYLQRSTQDPNTSRTCNAVVLESARRDSQIKAALASAPQTTLIYPSTFGPEMESAFEQLLRKLTETSDNEARVSKVTVILDAMGSQLTPRTKQDIKTACGKSAQDCSVALLDRASSFFSLSALETLKRVVPTL
ncbi:MAG TPA: hypothetical protein VFS87_03235 [Qipengyuania sp.]|nr:hypothetical protein [Qipengyuania sp.]